MNTTTPPPHPANASPALSSGLGGPLWLFAWPLAAAPPFLAPIYAARLWRWPPSFRPVEPLEAHHSIMWMWQLLLLFALWRAALLFFRRAAGFPVAWLILVTILWSGSIASDALDVLLRDGKAWQWSMLAGMLLPDRFVLGVSIIPTLYLWLSPHARRAFRGGPSEAWGPPWLPGVLRHGPDDWSRGLWLVPGCLVCMLHAHVHGALNVAAEALQSVPAPVQSASGLHSGFEAMMLSSQHVHAARLQWGMHLLALSLWPFAWHAFVRRRPRTVWLVTAMLAATIAAPLSWVVIDPPPLYLDGPDHEAELLAAIVLGLLVLPALWSARVRGRFRPMPAGMGGRAPSGALPPPRSESG